MAHGACLDCILLGLQVTAGLGFSSVQMKVVHIGKCEYVTS